MHRAFLDIVIDRARYMVSRASSVSRLQHNGLRGAVREAFVRELLRPLLPVKYIIGQGEIISAYEGTSNQVDIVIVDRRILPSILIDQDAGIFPIEASLMTMEVKSTLSSADLRQAEASAKKISKFHHAPPVGHQGFSDAHSIEHVVPGLLAFATDLKGSGKTEIDDTKKFSMTKSLRSAFYALSAVVFGFTQMAIGTTEHCRTNLEN